MLHRRANTPATAPRVVQARAEGGRAVRRLTGLGAVFYDGSPGSEYIMPDFWGEVRERLMPSCFDAALRRGERVVGLFNHDVNWILGSTDAGTMTLSVDAKGLRYSIDAPDNPLAQSVVQAVELGNVTGSSFSFDYEDVRWRETTEGDKEVLILEVLSVRLFDTGPVVFPAYQLTTAQVEGQRSRPAPHRPAFTPDRARRANGARKRLRVLQLGI